jgi:hypothetical protein
MSETFEPSSVFDRIRKAEASPAQAVLNALRADVWTDPNRSFCEKVGIDKVRLAEALTYLSQSGRIEFRMVDSFDRRTLVRRRDENEYLERFRTREHARCAALTWGDLYQSALPPEGYDPARGHYWEERTAVKDAWRDLLYALDPGPADLDEPCMITECIGESFDPVQFLPDALVVRPKYDRQEWHESDLAFAKHLAQRLQERYGASLYLQVDGR